MKIRRCLMIAVKISKKLGNCPWKPLLGTALSNCLWGRYSRNRYFNHCHECIRWQWVHISSQHISPHFYSSLPPFDAHTQAQLQGEGEEEEEEETLSDPADTSHMSYVAHTAHTTKARGTGTYDMHSTKGARGTGTNAAESKADPRTVQIHDSSTCSYLRHDWARGGTGAFAPSCREPQGHDQTMEICALFFFDFISSCLILFFPDLRRVQVGQKKSCNTNFSCFSILFFLHFRPPQVKKLEKVLKFGRRSFAVY